MNDLNNWHPYPRYGLAAAAVMTNRVQADFSDPLILKAIIIQSLEMGLDSYMLQPDGKVGGKEDQVRYRYLDAKQLNPGKGSGQISKNGYYTGPHILTGNNAADLVKEIKKLIGLLSDEKTELSKPLELKRSFAPLVSKLNNGRVSMQNPKADLLTVACTAIATLSADKAATYTKFRETDKNPINLGIIPDLPFYVEETDTYPLIDYLRLFRVLCAEMEGEYKLVGKYEKEYKRPAIFQGNYPSAPRNGSIGAVSLLVAIGEWANKAKLLGEDNRGRFAEEVLNQLSHRPLYLVSNSGTRQESFGHHLITLTLGGDMKAIVEAINRTHLITGNDSEKGKQALTFKYQLMADRFLRLFTYPSFKDFLSFRAEYPRNILKLFELYIMTHKPSLTPELITSARIYGESLNLAAYIAASEEIKDDQKKKRQPRPVSEYKDKILSQFEGTIRSAKSGTALLSQLSTIAGRITKREIDSRALPFMEAVALGEQEDGIALSTAQELITAFMRVSTYRPKTDTQKDEAPIASSTADDPMPQ